MQKKEIHKQLKKLLGDKIYLEHKFSLREMKRPELFALLQALLQVKKVAVGNLSAVWPVIRDYCKYRNGSLA